MEVSLKSQPALLPTLDREEVEEEAEVKVVLEEVLLASLVEEGV